MEDCAEQANAGVAMLHIGDGASSAYHTANKDDKENPYKASWDGWQGSMGGTTTLQEKDVLHGRGRPPAFRQFANKAEVDKHLEDIAKPPEWWGNPT